MARGGDPIAMQKSFSVKLVPGLLLAFGRHHILKQKPLEAEKFPGSLMACG